MNRLYMNNSYVNFDKSVVVKREMWVPKSCRELVSIVVEHEGKKIRVSGGIHVFNDLSVGEVMIKTNNLDRILHLNLKDQTVFVEAGIKFKKLIKYLYVHKLALHIIPGNLMITLGGALATGTHGSLVNRGPLAEAVLELIMIKANGNAITIKYDDPIFRACTCSLGTMGVIYAVKLQCEPLYEIYSNIWKLKWVDLEPNLINLLMDHNYSQISVNPKDETCTVFARTKQVTSESPRETTSLYFNQLATMFESNPYSECEIMIEFCNLKFAMVDLFMLFKGPFKYEDALSLRFIGRDISGLISMASDRDINVAISMFTSPNTNGELYRKFHDLLVTKYNGRPHYGKRHFLTPDLMNKLYPELQRFKKIRRDLDPKCMFINDAVKRLLGITSVEN